MTPEQRLEKQAAAILALRKDRDTLTLRVQRLEQAVSILMSAHEGRAVVVPGQKQDRSVPEQVAHAVSFTGTTGTYVPNAACVVCGTVKFGNRTALTCGPCGKERNRVIRERDTAARPNYTTCGNCGAAKSGGMQLLCGPCQKSFKAYKQN